MNIAFVDLSGIDFTPLTPETAPLGGMQSGLCYLSQSLQRLGHRVTLVNNTTSPGEYSGVRLTNFHTAVESREFVGFDAVVSISCQGRFLRPLVGRKPLVLFTGHNSKERSTQALRDAEERESWDLFVFKSNWQAEAMRETFTLNGRDIRIVTNAVAPFFHQARERTSYFFNEGRPPLLYFSSTPFRGLEVLCRAFPLIERAIPGVRARIFSSMKPYHSLANDGVHDSLYEACRNAGMEYVGSVDQKSLSSEVRRADVLAFPSTYPETSCITIMEAMASSTVVVTRALGAIPETSAGFAYLMPAKFPRGGPDLPRLYADLLVAAVRECYASPQDAAIRLERQRRYSAVNYDWDRKAVEWEALLQEVVATKQSNVSGGGQVRRDATESAVYNYVQTIQGKRIYLDPRDGRAKRMLSRGGTFNPETVFMWTVALGWADWNVIIDVGANYGEMLIEPGVATCPYVLAVEPNPRILPYLSATVAANRNITIVKAAVAESEGERTFAVHPNWSGMSGLGDGPEAITVRTTTIDSLVSGRPVNGTGDSDAFEGARLLLKIDVEGGEPDVLRGAVRAMDRSKEFCCLIEVAHLDRQFLEALERRFHIYALHRERGQVERIDRIEQVRLEGSAYWGQDVILQRRDEPAARSLE